jgi:uncharacterized BrkB/YihY/UPF0761 family membrane protein
MILQGAKVPMGYITFGLVALPTIFALISDVFSDVALDTVLPSFFAGFLIGNQTLLNYGGEIAVAAPYLFLVAVVIWIYFFLNPSKRRIEKMKTRQADTKAR